VRGLGTWLRSRISLRAPSPQCSRGTAAPALALARKEAKPHFLWVPPGGWDHLRNTCGQSALESTPKALPPCLQSVFQSRKESPSTN
jgi:hypothetical protein